MKRDTPVTSPQRGNLKEKLPEVDFIYRRSDGICFFALSFRGLARLAAVHTLMSSREGWRFGTLFAAFGV